LSQASQFLRKIEVKSKKKKSKKLKKIIRVKEKINDSAIVEEKTEHETS